VLRADERELGICLADLGAGSAILIVFQQGALAAYGSDSHGGDHFTSDLSLECAPGSRKQKASMKKFWQCGRDADSGGK